MEIYDIILEQQVLFRKWIEDSHPVKRELEPLFNSFLKTSMIKVIMGPRRCGKSFFSIQSLPANEIIYINFDDERFFDLKTSDLNKVYVESLRINAKPSYLIFDEIQNILGWELFINRLKRKGLNIIVTGSNSNLLSKELATHLTGRTLSLELFPFSFREYLSYFDISYKNYFLPEEKALIKNKFEQYLKYGGYPETFNNPVSGEYLRELFSRVISKDVIQRYQIRDAQSLRAIAHIMMSYNSQELSYQKIKNAFANLSINTLKKYITFLEDTYLFYEIETYSTKVRERLTKTRKVYSVDTGMFNALSDNSHKTLGRQLENLVFIELRRQQKNITYLKTKNFEIDFVISESGKISEIIQVCWSLFDHKTKERELKSLEEAEKVLGKNKKTILTLDEEFMMNDIKVLPTWKWLLLHRQSSEQPSQV